MEDINNLIKSQIFYHSSPFKQDILNPQQAKGHNDFENLNAIFMTKSFDQAGLYAIGKTIKGLTWFMITSDPILYILKQNNLELKSGWVYKLSPDQKDIISGPEQQFAILKSIKPIETIKVNPDQFKDKILYIDSKEEFANKAKQLFPNKLKR